MSESGEAKKKEKPITLKGFTAIMMALDSEGAHTSFGNLPLSKETSEPQYGFPAAKKGEADKVFVSEEHAKTNNASKFSPGPIYDVREDQAKYSKAPQFGFGTADRFGESKGKYDHYENDRFLDDPIEADLSRANRVLAPKIGTEPRMPAQTMEKTPGPQYYPGDPLSKKVAAKYTMGYRRNKGSQNVLRA